MVNDDPTLTWSDRQMLQFRRELHDAIQQHAKNIALEQEGMDKLTALLRRIGEPEVEGKKDEKP